MAAGSITVDEKIRFAWPVVVTIVTASVTMIWLLAQLSTDMKHLATTVEKAITRIESHEGRLHRLEAR